MSVAQAIGAALCGPFVIYGWSMAVIWFCERKGLSPDVAVGVIFSPIFVVGLALVVFG